MQALLAHRKQEATDLLDRSHRALTAAGARPEALAAIARLALSDLGLIEQINKDIGLRMAQVLSREETASGSPGSANIMMDRSKSYLGTNILL